METRLELPKTVWRGLIMITFFHLPLFKSFTTVFGFFPNLSIMISLLTEADKIISPTRGFRKKIKTKFAKSRSMVVYV